MFTIANRISLEVGNQTRDPKLVRIRGSTTNLEEYLLSLIQ